MGKCSNSSPHLPPPPFREETILIKVKTRSVIYIYKSLLTRAWICPSFFIRTNGFADWGLYVNIPLKAKWAKGHLKFLIFLIFEPACYTFTHISPITLRRKLLLAHFINLFLSPPNQRAWLRGGKKRGGEKKKKNKNKNNLISCFLLFLALSNGMKELFW